MKTHKYMNTMKKYLLLVVTLLFGVMAGYAQDKYSINRNDLPEAAQKFLTDYFPKAKVGMVKTDRHLLKKTDYDVKLVNGTKIEFNNAGKWTSVDCKTREVPEGIIPKSIRTYVKKNFPDVKIVKIEKSSTKYEVELSDDVELTFNLLGQFKSMKMDD
ncbi:MAG: PepSY-like domain-containing protein [Muribaculaceae bacterium]|nr:PepSY-like domain-containing protein [Muribaculaceae bacterium]